MNEDPLTIRGPTRNDRPAWHFFAFTFGLSWGAWLPGWLLMHGILGSSPGLHVVVTTGQWLGGVGPSIAAFLVVARDHGRKGLTNLLRRALRVKIGVWYLPALLIVPGAVALAQLLNVTFGGSLPEKDIHSTPWMVVPLFMVFLVMQAAEKFGWRGFALDDLQKRSNALAASLVLGVAWAVWHLPMFVIASAAPV